MPPVISLDPTDYTYSNHNGTCAHNQFLSGYLEAPFSCAEKDSADKISALDRSSSADYHKDP